MPRYEYQCDQCGHRFEVRQGIREEPLQECPECGAAIRRVIHPVGIVFKGSGFYINDSRSKSSATSTATASGDGAEKKATPDSTDSKPAAAAASATGSSAESTSVESKGT